jgi:hypothetical protein
MHKLCAMQDLTPTRAVAERLHVSVWTVTRLAQTHRCYTSKFPTQTGGYLFSDADIDKLAALINREVAA